MYFVIILLSSFIANGLAFSLFIEERDADGKMTAQYGSNIAITCTYLTVPPERAVIEWFAPRSPQIPISSDLKSYVYCPEEVDKRKCILVVRSVSTDDSGRYTCRLGIQDGDRFMELAKDYVDLLVERSIITTDCPKEQWIPVHNLNSTDTMNHAAIIRCVIQAVPSPIIDWQFKGRHLSTGGRYRFSSDGLTIVEPMEEDAGIYTIVARQPKNTAIFDIEVFVFSPPHITHGPVIYGSFRNTVIAGDEAYFQCLASGKPPPTVHWYHERDSQIELQKLNPEKFFVNTNSRYGMLRIAKVDYPEDSGVYICRAIIGVPSITTNWNSQMIAEAMIRVNITLRPEMIPLETMHRFVDLGDTVTVQCRVRSTEPLDLYYRKLYSNRSYTRGVQEDDPRISVRHEIDKEDSLNHNLFLTIKNVTKDDTWNYTCHAKNPSDYRWWNTTIRVMQTPQMIQPTAQLPHTDERSPLRFGWRDNATNLTCASFGMPHPVWTWYRHGEQILNAVNSTFTIISFDHWNWSQSWLQIRPCRHTEHFVFDEYVCKATNLKGTNESKVRLERASIPGQPIVDHYTVTQSVLELFVQPPIHTGGMPPLGYELTYSAVGGPGRWYGPVYFPLDASAQGARPRLRIHGLVGGTGYHAQIAARSIVGTGTPFGFAFRTMESTRPGPVEQTTAPMAVYPYSHIINWIPPDNGGSPLLGYHIRIRKIVLADSQMTTYPVIAERYLWYTFQPDFNNPYLNHYYLIDLEPEQTYQVVIEAQNEHGRSLDGITFEHYGYVNRTPSRERPEFITPDNLISRLSHASDLIPTWSYFQTPKGDPGGPPPKVFGSASSRCPQFLVIVSSIWSYVFLF